MLNARSQATHRALQALEAKGIAAHPSSAPALLCDNFCHTLLTCGGVLQVVEQLGVHKPGADAVWADRVGEQRGHGPAALAVRPPRPPCSAGGTSPFSAAAFLHSLSPCCNLYPVIYVCLVLSMFYFFPGYFFPWLLWMLTVLRLRWNSSYSPK